MSDIKFIEDAWNEYQYWLFQDKKMLRKINALLKEVQRTPFEGTGKPEPLKGDLSGSWSRRITEKDRLIYRFEDDTVIVLQCKGHYEDK